MVRISRCRVPSFFFSIALKEVFKKSCYSCIVDERRDHGIASKIARPLATSGLFYSNRKSSLNPKFPTDIGMAEHEQNELMNSGALALH